ncbi:MAG: oxidoreductase [Betaproteobacteria bacterium]
MTEARPKKALLAGASGLVGAHVLARLLAHPAYAQVEVLVRRELSIRDPKCIQRIVDFERLDSAPHPQADDVFCCLGTTLKQAGSRDAFRRVDHDYPVALARLALAGGARQFLMVSALGARANAGVFYSRVKGETEQDIGALRLPRVVFMRPSLLLGERRDKRPGERAGIVISKLIAPLLRGPLRKYRPIHADDVAAAMLYAANHETRSGPIESDQMLYFAQREPLAP